MRVVLENTRGSMKGIFQILGTVDQIKADLKTSELPDYLAPINFPDHVGAASLIGVKRRYVYYRELIEPTHANKNFHPSQQ